MRPIPPVSGRTPNTQDASLPPMPSLPAQNLLPLPTHGQPTPPAVCNMRAFHASVRWIVASHHRRRQLAYRQAMAVQRELGLLPVLARIK